MRIVLVAPEFPPAVGGMATYAEQIAALLSASGHAIRVVTAKDGAQPGANYSIEGCLTGRYAADVRTLQEVAASADVVFLVNAGFAGLASQTETPVVARTVGNDVYGAWIGPRVPLRFLYWRLPHGPGSLGSHLRRVDQERRVTAVVAGLRRCAAVLCNSTYTRSRLGELGVPDAILHVVPGGVDTKRFSPDGPRRPTAGSIDSPSEDSIVIGTAGVLRPIKGFSIAIEAMAALAPQWPRLTLAIAGNGGEREALERQAMMLGVSDRVQFLGSIAQGQMPDFYRGLNVYLQPSVTVQQTQNGVALEESMGRALCEAQACGVPVVASRCGGVPEVVADGTTGILVPPGDAPALARAIEQILQSPDGARLMGTAGRTAAVERFSWGAVAAATEAQLMSAARPTRVHACS